MVEPNSTFTNIDGAAGCYRNDVFTVQRTFEALAKKNGQVFTVAQSFPRTTFMSTVSILDLNWQGGLSQANMDKAIETGTDKVDNVVNKKQTPFSDVFSSKDNLQHVEIDEDLQTWAVAESNESGEEWFANNTLSTAYNFGRKKNTIPSLNINSGGNLQVNVSAATGYANSPDPTGYYDYDVSHVHIGSCGGTVNVNSGGKITLGATLLGSNGVLLNRKGVFHVSPGSTLNSNGGQINLKVSELIIESNANAVFKTGSLDMLNSTITVKDKGKLFLESSFASTLLYSKIIIEKGGKLFLKGNAKSLISSNSQIIVEAGGELIVQENAVTTLQNNSQILIRKNGKLNLEKGTPAVTFNGICNGGVCLTSITIEGELQVNAPIKMNGTAFFDFVPGHKLTLLSTFDLTGENKARKMINLQKSTTLSLKNQDIVFANGGIIYGEGTKIQMPSQKTVYFGNINFEASPDDNIFTTGLTNQNSISPTSITINGCTFLNLARDIELVHNDVSQSPASIDITGSAFIDYKKFGILLDKSLRMNVTGSSFSTASTNGGYQSSNIELYLLGLPSNFPPAIIARDVPAIIDLKSCEIAGNDAATFKEAYEEYMSDKSTVYHTHACNILNDDYANDANAILNGFNYAIYLQNVPHFYLTHGTTIHDAFTGIYARSGSNVIMRQGAALIKNGIGVNMIGQKYIDKNKPTAGLFFMDCSSLLENAIGVLGKNIVLATDEFVNSNNNNSNYFTNYVSEKTGIKG